MLTIGIELHCHIWFTSTQHLPLIADLWRYTVFSIAVRSGGGGEGGKYPPVGGNQKFCWRGIILSGWWKPEGEWFWKPFSKLTTAFCESWTSNKITIGMTCVSKEYEIKTKMVQEKWLQLKMLFLLGYTLKSFNWWEAIHFWRGENKNVGGGWEERVSTGGICKFLAGGGTHSPCPHPHSPVAKTLLTNQ